MQVDVDEWFGPSHPFRGYSELGKYKTQESTRFSIDLIY